MERLVVRLDERSKQLHEQMAEHAADYEKVAELDAPNCDGVAAEREKAEEAWLVAAEAADWVLTVRCLRLRGKGRKNFFFFFFFIDPGVNADDTPSMRWD